jgi:glucose-6-phosphate 1-epimerase
MGDESFHGMPAMSWQSRDGAVAMATLQGAQLVSWRPAGGEECLYVSERSPFEAGRPIRGGIPVCFPQFADRGALPQHGFARNLAWRFEGLEETGQGARARFSLESSEATLAAWSHAFRLVLTATIGGPHLHVELTVENRGEVDFAFTAALHTYLRVADATRTRLLGLKGTRYLERGTSERVTEQGDAVTAASPIDRVYFAAPASTRLEDIARSFALEQGGFVDTVAWNPGRERTATMADMSPDGYLRMFCVEAAAVDPPIRLAAGSAWKGSQSIVEWHLPREEP